MVTETDRLSRYVCPQNGRFGLVVKETTVPESSAVLPSQRDAEKRPTGRPLFRDVKRDGEPDGEADSDPISRENDPETESETFTPSVYNPTGATHFGR